MKNSNNITKLTALLLGLALTAAACGSDDDVSVEAPTAQVEDAGDEAMEDEEAMEDDEAMEDEEAMEDDDAMEDDAMEDDAMEDDAMEDDAMEDDAMEDDAMEDGDAMSEGRPIINLTFDGLEPLGDDFNYELWTLVDGEPVSGGIFDVDASGEIVIVGDQAHLYGHEGATDVIISIEPADDADPAPSDDKPLAGAIAEDGTFVLEATDGASTTATVSGAQV